MITAHYLWTRKQKSVTGDVEQMHHAQHNDNEQRKNMQRNDSRLRESNDSMYIKKNEMVADYVTKTTEGDNDEQKKCDDRRKEGEPTLICEVTDTDAGDV